MGRPVTVNLGQYSFYATYPLPILKTDAYLVSDLRLGYRYAGESWSFESFAGIYNLFDESYNGNIRVNAAFGRYYEPAPERNGYAGIQLGFRY